MSPAPGGGGSSGGGSSAGTADLAVVKQRMEEILNTPSESFDSVLKYFNDPVMISFTLSFDGEEACELAGSDDEDDEPTCMENEPVALEDFVTLEEEDGDISYGGVHYLFIWKVMFPEPEDSEELPDLVKVEIEHSDVVVKADGASIVAAYEMSYTFEITLPDPENPEGTDAAHPPRAAHLPRAAASASYHGTRPAPRPRPCPHYDSSRHTTKPTRPPQRTTIVPTTNGGLLPRTSRYRRVESIRSPPSSPGRLPQDKTA